MPNQTGIINANVTQEIKKKKQNTKEIQRKKAENTEQMRINML